MLQITDKTQCCGCHACYSICPKKCITMQSDEDGFLYPQVNTESCIKCGLCINFCPIQNKKQMNIAKEPMAYAAMNRNESVRLKSSSGGVFSLIAEYVIAKGGVVFGVALDGNWEAVHRCAESMEEIAPFRGSKYMQSRIGDSYLAAERFLKEGRTVLFSATPCQIAGLQAFLKKPYDNLITQDIICHGVPSVKVWKKYVQYREEKAGAKTRKILFRHKKYGWKRSSLMFVFENQKEYVGDLAKDLYLRSFLSDLCLRPSCYACSFKEKARPSDLTLADYWGIQAIHPSMDDDKGTSLVIVHSEKGKRILDAISKDLCVFPTDLESALRYNSAMIRSASKPKNRDEFMHSIHDTSFDRMKQMYLRERMWKRVKKCIRRVLSKIKRIIKKFLK